MPRLEDMVEVERGDVHLAVRVTFTKDSLNFNFSFKADTSVHLDREKTWAVSVRRPNLDVAGHNGVVVVAEEMKQAADFLATRIRKIQIRLDQEAKRQARLANPQALTEGADR